MILGRGSYSLILSKKTGVDFVVLNPGSSCVFFPTVTGIKHQC